MKSLVGMTATASAVLLASFTPPAQAQSRVEAEEICRIAVAQRGFDVGRFQKTDARSTGGNNHSVTGYGVDSRGRRFEFSCELDGRRVRFVNYQRAGGGDNDGWPGGGGSQTVTCESKRFGHDHCGMDTSRGVRLVEQVSDTPCRRGENWGIDRRGVWVDQGCAARFRAGGGGSSDGGRPGEDDSVPERLNAACVREVAESQRIDWRDVRAGRGRAVGGGMYEINVRTYDGIFVCAVDRRGDVRSVTRR